MLQHKGVTEVYLETAFTGLLVLWGLLAAFRPEWRHSRHWFVLLGIVVAHAALWILVERRVGHVGFIPMFTVVVVEFAIGAAVVVRVIPEDVQAVLDYIRRW